MNLFEEVALTKGSQRVLNDKKLVAGIADSIRDDVAVNASTFPSGFAQQAKKADDETLARWFLENLDKIEREGYEGTVYSRDGVNNDWIARRYIAGSHTWEDIIGVLNMNLRDFYALKNRNLLDANHRDIPKFNSIRELGKYLTIHYGKDLAQVRDAAKQAAIQKQAKSAKLVDNEDYRIYTVFNWAAARALGLGTQWCTANSSQDVNYNGYSDRAMLFQLYPKNPEKIDKVGNMVGKRTVGDEKYQFDAGSLSFNDIADDRVPAEYIKEKFPYIYSDLVSALRANKESLEQAMEKMAEDPSLNSTKEGKTKTYDVNQEIDKLSKFITSGYFTNKNRPAAKEEPAGEQNQLTNEEYIMEMDKDVKAMMESLKKYDQLLNESAKKSEIPAVHRKEKGGDWKVTIHDLDKEESESPTGKKGLEKLKKEKGISEAEEHCHTCDHPKDECVCKCDVMEGIDADVAEWMKRLERIGKLSEEKKPDADGDGVPDWADKKPGKDDHEEEKVDEGIDPEVLSWMKRFNRLGRLS